MSPLLTDPEWEFLSAVPEMDLVRFAVELDVLVPERLDARALIDQCIPALFERALAEGLPLSKYDREDLEALPVAHREALSRLVGRDPATGVDGLLDAGRRTWKLYQRTRPDSAVALLLPSLLPALARIAADQGVRSALRQVP